MRAVHAKLAGCMLFVVVGIAGYAAGLSAAVDTKAWETKIENVWDQGDVKNFEALEKELTGQVSDKDADGCLILAKFYYRYSLLYAEKANTAKQHWLDEEKYVADKAAWAKGGEKVEKALEYIKKADEMRPEDLKILSYYTLIKYRKIRHCDGMVCAMLHMKSLLDVSKKTIEKGGNDLRANLGYGIYKLGRSQKMGGNPREAITYFQQAAKLDPNNAECCFWLGKFFMSPNIKFQPKLARPQFEKAVAFNPNNWLYKETLEQFNKEYPPEK